MIRKTLLILGSLVLSAMVAVSACSSSVNATASDQKNLENQLSAAVQRDKIMRAENSSLWNSELFNDSLFTLNIKLTAAERKEAHRLARSFEDHMENSSLFMYHLLSELKARNMPIELAALPLVESGFNPRARSGAGAHGPWQFIRSTGKALGLERTKNYDEFYDFIASTDASLRFLDHLYQECDHNWDLAIAAYNQGEYSIKQAIKRAKEAGVAEINLNTVKLSAGAKAYVRRFHAYADILKNPQKYGVDRPEIKNRPAFKRVQIAGRLNSMKQASKLSGAKLSTLKHLNAGYLSDSLQSNKPRGLLVPIENARRLEKAIGIEVPTTEQGTTQDMLSAVASNAPER